MEDPTLLKTENEELRTEVELLRAELKDANYWRARWCDEYTAVGTRNQEYFLLVKEMRAALERLSSMPARWREQEYAAAGQVFRRTTSVDACADEVDAEFGKLVLPATGDTPIGEGTTTLDMWQFRAEKAEARVAKLELLGTAAVEHGTITELEKWVGHSERALMTTVLLMDVALVRRLVNALSALGTTLEDE